MMTMAGLKKVASEPTTAQLRKAANVARKAGVPPLAEKHKVASAAERKRKPKGDSIDSKAALKAGRVALDRTKEALKAGPPLSDQVEAKAPVVLTSHMLRTAAQKAKVARDLITAEKYEMAARRLDMRGPREVASGTHIPASINQRKTSRALASPVEVMGKRHTLRPPAQPEKPT